MCLAIPSKITHIENNMATIDVDGVQREASLLLLEGAEVDDYVIVHAGFAIQKIDESCQMRIWFGRTNQIQAISRPLL